MFFSAQSGSAFHGYNVRFDGRKIWTGIKFCYLHVSLGVAAVLADKAFSRQPKNEKFNRLFK